MTLRSALAASVAVAFWGVVAANGSVAATLSTTDFNAFANGTVNGQGGWSITGAYDQEVVNLEVGNRALRISNRVTSGSFGDQLFAPKPGTYAGETSTIGEYGAGVIYNHLTATFDFRSATTLVQDDARSTISTDDGNGGRQSFIALRGCGAGAVCVDTFDVDAGGNFVGPVTIASGLTGWHEFAIDVLFQEGPNNDVVTYSVDGVVVHTDTSWENFYSNFQAAEHPGGVANQTLLFRESGASCNACQGFLIDNVEITADVVPEPATLGLLGLGLIGLAAIRRRRG